MKKNTKDYKIWIILGALILIISLWFGSWIYTDYKFPNLEGMSSEEISKIIAERGSFGDKFGFVNSLFSGLALTGIIISIYFQQKELSLQRKELIETREEFKDQNFQTTFFNLIKTQRQLGEEILTTIWNLKSYDEHKKIDLKGRQFFIQSRIELLRIKKSLQYSSFLMYYEWNEEMEYHNSPSNHWEAEDLTKTRIISYTNDYYKISKEIWDKSQSLSSIELGKLCYAIFFNKFHFMIGHYFRHIYHIFDYLLEKENERLKDAKEDEKNEIKNEFTTYANFVQAQMSTPELFLLFYNSLSFPKLKKLLIKFNILENLTIEDLLSEEDNCIDGINLKRRKELLK